MAEGRITTTPFERRLADIIEPTLQALGYELVRLRVMGGSETKTLQIMAERTDGSFTIDDCTLVSRTLSPLLDVEDPFEGEYNLEVSSPGIDRPILRLKDFTRYAGHVAKVETALPIDGRKRFKGVLGGVDGETILIAVDDKASGVGEPLARIPFDMLADAKLVLTDDLIAAARAAAPIAEGADMVTDGQEIDVDAAPRRPARPKPDKPRQAKTKASGRNGPARARTSGGGITREDDPDV